MTKNMLGCMWALKFCGIAPALPWDTLIVITCLFFGLAALFAFITGDH